MRKLILTLAVALVLAGTAYGSQPAQAAGETWVYVVINNSACSPIGQNLSIRNINTFNVQETSWTAFNDYGDNIIYPKVKTYRTNHFFAVADCYKKTWWGGWQHVGKRELWGTFYPTRYQQTFWVG